MAKQKKDDPNDLPDGEDGAIVKLDKMDFSKTTQVFYPYAYVMISDRGKLKIKHSIEETFAAVKMMGFYACAAAHGDSEEAVGNDLKLMERLASVFNERVNIDKIEQQIKEIDPSKVITFKIGVSRCDFLFADGEIPSNRLEWESRTDMQAGPEDVAWAEEFDTLDFEEVAEFCPINDDDMLTVEQARAVLLAMVKAAKEHGFNLKVENLDKMEEGTVY